MSLFGEYIEFWQSKYDSIFTYTYEHIYMSAVSLLIGILISIPLAIWLTRSKSGLFRNIVFNIANLFQTIPTIAMLALMIPLLGIGMKPAITALFLYSLLPLLRNTYSGLQSIDQDITEAAKGMGLNSFQRLMKVELPLAMPYIMSGVRVTTVYIISWTTLAAIVGAGGLGTMVIAGIGFNNKFMIFTGTILAVLMALLADLLFERFEKIGKRKRREATT